MQVLHDSGLEQRKRTGKMRSKRIVHGRIDGEVLQQWRHANPDVGSFRKEERQATELQFFEPWTVGGSETRNQRLETAVRRRRTKLDVQASEVRAMQRR